MRCASGVCQDDCIVFIFGSRLRSGKCMARSMCHILLSVQRSAAAMGSERDEHTVRRQLAASELSAIANCRTGLLTASFSRPGVVYVASASQAGCQQAVRLKSRCSKCLQCAVTGVIAAVLRRWGWSPRRSCWPRRPPRSAPPERTAPPHHRMTAPPHHRAAEQASASSRA